MTGRAALRSARLPAATVEAARLRDIPQYQGEAMKFADVLRRNRAGA